MMNLSGLFLVSGFSFGFFWGFRFGFFLGKKFQFWIKRAFFVSLLDHDIMLLDQTRILDLWRRPRNFQEFLDLLPRSLLTGGGNRLSPYVGYYSHHSQSPCPPVVPVLRRLRLRLVVLPLPYVRVERVRETRVPPRVTRILSWHHFLPPCTRRTRRDAQSSCRKYTHTQRHTGKA